MHTEKRAANHDFVWQPRLPQVARRRSPVAVLCLAAALVLPIALRAAPAAEKADRDVSQPVVFYLHGKIVEDQGREATSERFGRYEYDGIVSALGSRGFEVISEVRQPGTDPWQYARAVVSRIEELKADGVPSERITVVGASKGAAIAVLVSHLLDDPDVSFVFLAICGERMLEYWKSNDICVAGHILSIYEASDELAQSCGALAERCDANVSRYKEIRLDLGVGHGMVYRPFDDWLKPVLDWATREQPSE
jgi:hypothetical protein